jgi:dihydrofolate reductase
MSSHDDRSDAGRKVTFGVASSLDNFIAREDHAVDWLMWSDEVGELTSSYWKTVDTVVMGRKTYEAAVANGLTAYPDVRNYVFSRTMEVAPDPRVEIVRGDAADFVRGLKAGEGKGICVMGGGEVARDLFAAELIDEVGLNIHPVLLGSGIPLFHGMSRQIDLELIDHKVLRNGCVYVLYRVKR